MKRVSINKLKKIYNHSLRKDLVPKLKFFPRYIYLYLSVHLSRDEREFDIHNYTDDLLMKLKRNKDIKTAPAKGLFLWRVNY